MSVDTDGGPLGLDEASLAAALGVDRVLEHRVSEVDYPLEMLTTGGRWWVEGHAERDGGVQPFRLFVKRARCASRSPVMQLVPEPMRAVAVATLPWQVEPDVYRSDLAEVLPEGARMPRCHAVVDVDELSAEMWLEAVRVDDRPWTDDDRAAAARFLGRLAASSAVAGVADRVGHVSGPRQARVYWEGRLTHQFGHAYRDGGVFEHPVVAEQVDAAVRDRLLGLLDAVPALIDEIEALPLLSAHGDACPQNLLRAADGFVVVDWGFFCRGRLGFDLSQLVVSEVELGRAPGTEVARLQPLVLEAYRDGLAEEGVQVPADDLLRAHRVQLALANGVSAVPIDHLDAEPDLLRALLRERLVVLDTVLTPLGL